MSAAEFPRPHAVADIGTSWRRYDIAANTDELVALSRRFDLLQLDSFVASFEMRREPPGIRVTGRITAAGAQPCVVSAEPVPFAHDEPVSLVFSETLPEGDDIELGSDDLDVEPLIGGILDLGEVAAQALGVALDPYPRLADAQAPAVISEAEARVRSSPFAVLKR